MSEPELLQEKEYDVSESLEADKLELEDDHQSAESDESIDTGEASRVAGVQTPVKYTSDEWWAANPTTQRCVAHRKNGEQCRKVAINGATVCRTHGGATRHIRRKARQRIEEYADRMARELLGLATSAESETVRLAAIRDALDRAGLKAPAHVEVEVGPTKTYEDLLAGLAASDTDVEWADMSREQSRAARGVPDVPGLPGELDRAAAALDDEIVDAEIVSDRYMYSQPERSGAGSLAGGVASAQEPTSNRPPWAIDDCVPTGPGNVPGAPGNGGTGLMTIEEANELLRQQEREYNLRAQRSRRDP